MVWLQVWIDPGERIALRFSLSQLCFSLYHFIPLSTVFLPLWKVGRAWHRSVYACIVLCLVIQSCPTLCDPMDRSPPGSSVHGDSPGRNTGVACRALFQGIFPTQESNQGLLHCKQILYHLSHQGSPRPTLAS